MKLKEIQDMWSDDSIIDRTELGNASIDIPKLHSKYFNLYSTERLEYKRRKADLNLMKRLRFEYYLGILSKEELEAHGWSPCLLKILKTDIHYYMDSDEHIQKIQTSVDLQEEKVNFLESIIKSLATRGLQIKGAIDWHKFTNGIV